MWIHVGQAWTSPFRRLGIGQHDHTTQTILKMHSSIPHLKNSVILNTLHIYIYIHIHTSGTRQHSGRTASRLAVILARNHSDQASQDCYAKAVQDFQNITLCRWGEEAAHNNHDGKQEAYHHVHKIQNWCLPGPVVDLDNQKGHQNDLATQTLQGGSIRSQHHCHCQQWSFRSTKKKWNKTTLMTWCIPLWNSVIHWRNPEPHV